MPILRNSSLLIIIFQLNSLVDFFVFFDNLWRMQAKTAKEKRSGDG